MICRSEVSQARGTTLQYRAPGHEVPRSALAIGKPLILASQLPDRCVRRSSDHDLPPYYLVEDFETRGARRFASARTPSPNSAGGSVRTRRELQVLRGIFEAF